MRTHDRPIRFCLALALLFVCALPASAEPWQAEDAPLSMQPPAAWGEFEPSLLETANEQVRHVTGRSFIAGYAHSTSAGTTLIFPYLLIQYEPYADLPEADRPAAKLDLPGKLELLTRVVDAMRPAENLPESIDIETFAQQFGSDLLRPLAMTDDGRFDLAGTIPAVDGADPIRYHTHGVFGKEGVAMVTVFAGEQFEELGPVIEGPLRTLQFDEGFAYADLPDAPPASDATGDDADADGDTSDDTPDAETQGPATTDDTDDVDDSGTQKTDATSESEDQADAKTTPQEAGDEADAQAGRSSGALVMILVVLGVALMVVVGIAAFVTHRQAQAKRERARARRERLEQSAT